MKRRKYKKALKKLLNLADDLQDASLTGHEKNVLKAKGNHLLLNMLKLKVYEDK